MFEARSGNRPDAVPNPLQPPLRKPFPELRQDLFGPKRDEVVLDRGGSDRNLQKTLPHAQNASALRHRLPDDLAPNAADAIDLIAAGATNLLQDRGNQILEG